MRLRAAVLGATGRVGQTLVRLLAHHPRIAPTLLVASGRSACRAYGEAVTWCEPEPIPDAVRRLAVRSEPPRRGECDLVFSCLPAPAARRLEPALAGRGLPVISNAAAFRLHPAVPLVVPEVNPQHLALLDRQDWDGEEGDRGGFLVTNPNCVVSGLVLVLAPLLRAFGLREVHVTTLQAASGAGSPGVPSLDLLGNTVPEIPGEGEKIRTEPGKILGTLDAGGVRPLDLPVTVQTFRVPVVDGHVLALRVRLGREVSTEAVRAALATPSPAPPRLASAPARPLRLLDGPHTPQPRLHAALDGGYAVAVGPVTRAAAHTFLLTAVVHNLVRGAAGGALLNAELLLSAGRLG